MKIIRYEWEDSYLFASVNKSLNIYDNFNSLSLVNKINVKSNLDTNKNIDFAKILSLNFLFSLNKSFLSLKESSDKNPLRLKANNKKSLNSHVILNNINIVYTLLYIYLIYLINSLRNKNIKLSNSFAMVYNTKIVELNSIFKVGHSYNVLDIDPSIELSFIDIRNPKLLKYYLE